MAESLLHEFDLQLCDYVRGNVLAQSGGDRYTAVLRNELPPELLEYLGLIGEADEQDQQLLLTTQDFRQLETSIDGLSDRFRLVWQPYLPLHGRSVYSVAEVCEQLTKQSAETWAERCASFAAQLEARELSLEDGIAVVSDWTSELRVILRAMGRNDLLPAPEGRFPTPRNGAPSTHVGDGESPALTTDPIAGTERLLSKEELSLSEAAELLDCDRKTVVKLIEDGLLQWRDAAPSSSTRRRYRLRTKSVVALRNNYQRGMKEAEPRQSPRQRRKSTPAYKPRHINPGPQ